MGELKALSKWRARYRGIGLDETLTDSAAERAGMLLVQVERFTKVLSTVVQQVMLWKYHDHCCLNLFVLSGFNDKASLFTFADVFAFGFSMQISLAGF